MTNKKDTYYFSHDANALSDPKILAMRCDYGLESYGLYWAIIELLRNETTYKLPLNKTTFRAIKMQTGTTIDVESYINDCINEYTDNETGNGLFNTDGKSFWSASLLRRMEKYETLKEKRSQAANARWNKGKNVQKNTKKCKCIKIKCISNANAYKGIYKCNANLKKMYAKLCKLNQIKSNQIKLNEIKLNKIKSIYPSDHIQQENQILDGMMDEMDKIAFDNIISQSNVELYDKKLSKEIQEIMKEIYMNPDTRENILKIELENIDYALRKFYLANTKSNIKKPKAYFKQCLLSALEETELSKHFDINSIN